MASNKLNEIISTALSEMKNISDGNTIIGEPIHLPSGTVIIPVSKVSMGLVSGGVDYNGKLNQPKAVLDNNFGGGGATGLSINPVCFLVCTPDGKVESIGVETPLPTDPISQATGMVENLPTLIEKIKALFPSKKEEEFDDVPNEEK